MPYVDGFLLPVPKRHVAAYRKLARKAARVFREHGALEYRECVGDDLAVKGVVPFTRTIRVKPSETVVFAWIVYRSLAHRDRVVAKTLADPRMQVKPESMPFDTSRMAYGGFKVIVDE